MAPEGEANAFTVNQFLNMESVMNSKLLSAALSLFALPSLFSAPSQAQGQFHHLPTNHVFQAVNNGQAKLVGHLPGSQTLQFDITLSLSHPDYLQQFLQAVYDQSSPQYRQFVTPEQFTERFGPTQSDYAGVVAFAAKHGFRQLGGDRNQMNLQFEGSAADIESAFGISLNVYQHPTESRTFYSPDREPTTDEPLAIWHVSGLDNFAIPRSAGLHSGLTQDNQPASGSGPGGIMYSSDFRAAYYGGNLTGTGQSVGLLQFSPFNPADVSETFATEGQTNTVPVIPISVGGAATTCAGTSCGTNEYEPIMDIVQAAAMAPGLSAIHVYVGNTNSDTAIFAANLWKRRWHFTE